jgi:hypothetical protein
MLKQHPYVIAVEVSGVMVVNKPPSSNWSSNTLVFPHPTFYVGDFNFHNQLWGYEHNNADGNRLLEWMTLIKIHRICKQKSKERSIRPDVCKTFNDNSRS